MHEDKVLFDIPASHKEYHNIEFDHERNRYFMFGHKSDDGISYLGMSIPASARITKDSRLEIVDIRMKNLTLTLYPLSVMIFYYGD